QIYNLGTAEYCQVKDSIGWICARLGLQPELRFTGGERGWVGDNPFIFLDTARIRSTGWEARLTIREGIIKTLN
ncbi:MAG: nucleoside-diphosphate sugar epimerase, partial [Gemmataceae bacterium]